ncbi:MAG: hypothetical protein Q9162_003127 [Coniocarpon cinnabarinum]
MAEGGTSTPDEMQNRIDRLEGLVLSLMSTGNPAAAQAAQAALGGPQSGGSVGSGEMDQDQQEPVDSGRQGPRDEDSEVERVSNSIGIMKVQNDRNIYASEGHWYAILSDIAEVKAWFAEHKKMYDEQARKVSAWKGTTAGTSMLFKGTARMDHRELLSNFPPRHVANELITRYFETENPATHIIHRPTYCKQYERHWTNPHMSTTAWLGMSFAMMSLALQSYHRAGDEPKEYRGRAWDNSLNYLELTTQALVVADFTQPIVYMVETLCLYLQAESARTRDAETGVWILVGIVARLAMRGEMRRRLWNFVRSADILMSYQCSMPSLIKSADCDTELPNNIFDEEFDEDSKALPPSRPLTEATPMSFMIVNCHLVFVLGKILEASSALTPISYETAMKLDNDLREVRTHVPPTLTLKTREESTLDPASLIMQRYSLDLVYQKSQVALHRKFLNKARENPRFAYSRRTCVEACLQMLKHQLQLHEEAQIGGRLHNVPWSITSAVSQSDFLLAAMVICLDLYHTAAAESRGQNQGELYEWAVSHREEMLGAVERAVAIWEALRDQSMEAFKASSILKVMLEKLRNHAALHQALGKNLSFGQPSQNGLPPDVAVAAPEHSAAMTLGMMSSGMTPDAMNLFGSAPGGFQTQRTGMTPQPAGSDMQQAQQGQTSQPGGAQAPMAPMSGGEGLTPFTNMLGGFAGGDLANGVGANLDWDAWDSFVAGTQMDTSGAVGSGVSPGFNNIDPIFSNTDPVAAAQQAEQAQRQQQQQQQAQGQSTQAGSNSMNGKADIKNPFPSLTQLYAPNGEPQQQGHNTSAGS